jgi:hypothetical protein
MGHWWRMSPAQAPPQIDRQGQPYYTWAWQGDSSYLWGLLGSDSVAVGAGVALQGEVVSHVAWEAPSSP